MMTFSDPFSEIAAVLAVAAAVGALAFWLRQPLIIAFIFVGILLGPAALDWVHALDQVDLFAKLGIGLLLFVVGLKLDLHLIRSVGRVAMVAGLGQMTMTAAIGYAVCLALGMTQMTAFYVTATLTFSSTVIIVKLLSDKREIDALHGRIAVGVLIMQDIVVVVLMIGLTAYGGETQEPRLGKQALEVIGKGAGFLALIALATRYLLPSLLHSLARWPELLTLFAIAWAIGLASLGAGLGFSKEVGAFVAGVALAATPYKAVLAARLVGLRDFLLLFFFIDLGIQIDMGHLRAALGPAILLSVIVLVGKPIMVTALVRGMRYANHTAVTTGLTMGQISEFSLILAALGLSLGHIDKPTMGLITLIGLITFGLSTYMILYSHWLCRWLVPALRFLKPGTPHTDENQIDTARASPSSVNTIVFGLGRYGRNLVQELRQRGTSVLSVDFDPERVRFWRERGLVAIYGDLEDIELFHDLPLADAQWVVSTIAGRDKCLVLLHALEHSNFSGRTALTADTMRHREFLLAAGADVVLLPFRDAAAEAASMLVSHKESCPARASTIDEADGLETNQDNG
jgi:Kef-type K+ transport system membrane component KefB